MLCYVMLCYAMLCSVMLCCIVLYCIVLYCTILYCIVLYCIVLYCTVLHCIALHCMYLEQSMLLSFHSYELVINIGPNVDQGFYTEEDAPHLMMVVARVSCQSWNASASAWQSSGCQVGLSPCSLPSVLIC